MSNESKYNWELIQGDLTTKWSKEVNPKLPFPEYPRPQFKRESWLNLNGLWDYSILSKSALKPVTYEGKILVPFAVESALSGVQRRLKPSQKLWYHRSFDLPEAWKGQDIIIHFGAVDWETQVWINGEYVGEHKGGYIPFKFEISKFIKFRGENEIIISVWDPTNRGRQERGKQRLKSWLIFYTAVSGIWSTVWIEPVPKTRIEKIFLIPNIDSSQLKINPIFHNLNKIDEIQILIKSVGRVIVKENIKAKDLCVLDIPNMKVWEPSNPFLYDLGISILRKGEIIDKIQSYFGMRKISIKQDKHGIPRLALNNKILFQYGVLDQGYWPDGLYTAPTDEALRFDVELAQQFGFNMIRKHVKIEPSRWYNYCDKMGILVWQDMPNGGSFFAGAAGLLFKQKLSFRYGRYKKSVKTQYYSELKEMIDSLFNHPSIIVWIPFNEAWGQFETKQVTEYIRVLDSSRLINSASGWIDKKTGDIVDIHKYVGPAMPEVESSRVAVLGEFGGLGFREENHVWNTKKTWGYKSFKTREELTNKYAEILTETLELKQSGLGAAIYTQLTDIEQEINGLVTYDREISKMNSAQVKKYSNMLYKKD